MKNNDLKNKTDKELREIMRNSIDNAYIPSSIYHKAKLELEFRNCERPKNKEEEIFKLTPEFQGVGINLKILFKRILSIFKK